MYIIGDLIIDKYSYVEAVKLSPEAPVPIVRLKDKVVHSLGGAGLAASYAKKHSINFSLVTKYNSFARKIVLHNFLAGETYRYSSFDKKMVDTIKHRYIDEATKYHLLRIDNDTFDYTNPIPDLVERVEKGLKYDSYPHQVLLFLDYCKGVFSNKNQCQDLISFARKNNLVTYADTRREDLMRFKGIDIIKLNESEFKHASIKYNLFSPADLRQRLNAKALIITKAAKGAELICKGNSSPGDISISFCPSAKESRAKDVTGAGDVFDVNYCNSLENVLNLTNELQFSDKILKEAVEKASSFVYEPVESRLKC